MSEYRPQINVSEAEYVRLLGYPRHHELTGRARELADWARAWYAEHGRPWVHARRTTRIERAPEGFSLDDVPFSSERLRRRLVDADAHAAMLVAVSAGPECEEHARRLWLEGKPDEYFFLEVYGSAVVEHLVTTTGARFCATADEAGEAVLPHYSPGYPEWDVAEQGRLLELIAGDESLPGALEAFDTGMLRPKKSLLAVFGITRQVERVKRLTELVPCSHCPMLGCRFRRVPYEHTRDQSGEVGFVRPRSAAVANGVARIGVTLNHNAAYSVSEKALAKWSDERTQLVERENRTLEALFRFEGTTCSNLGYPLRFDYRVVLDSPENDYRILEAVCGPSPGDEGYTLMCKYLKDADGLMSAIETEKPLLGKPLDDVFGWDRKFSPTGCYCDTAGRAHKWGLALEVIHFALVKHELQKLKREPEERTAKIQS